MQSSGCAISYFIAADSTGTRSRRGPVTTMSARRWNRYGHLVPGGEQAAAERLDAFLTPSRPTPTVAQTVAHDPKNDETPKNTGVL